MKRPLIELQKDEQILAMLRRSIIYMIPSLLLHVGYFLVPFLLFFFFFRLGFTGLVLFLALFIFGLLKNIAFWHKWNRSVFIVTNLRIFDLNQISFGKYELSELPYESIASIDVQQGRIAKLVDYGSVRIVTDESFSYDVSIANVRRPHIVASLIKDVQGAKK